jgi:hypothetical protein
MPDLLVSRHGPHIAVGLGSPLMEVLVDDMRDQLYRYVVARAGIEPATFRSSGGVETFVDHSCCSSRVSGR